MPFVITSVTPDLFNPNIEIFFAPLFLPFLLFHIWPTLSLYFLLYECTLYSYFTISPNILSIHFFYRFPHRIFWLEFYKAIPSHQNHWFYLTKPRELCFNILSFLPSNSTNEYLLLLYLFVWYIASQIRAFTAVIFPALLTVQEPFHNFNVLVTFITSNLIIVVGFLICNFYLMALVAKVLYFF